MKSPFEYIGIIVRHEKRNTKRALREMKRSNNYITQKRNIQIVNEIPHFRYKNEWICFPSTEQGGWYDFYDYVEDTAIYKEAYPIIDEIIKKELGDLYGTFGSCHEIWKRQKQLLLEMYGIEWFTPAELNILTKYD